MTKKSFSVMEIWRLVCAYFFFFGKVKDKIIKINFNFI